MSNKIRRTEIQIERHEIKIIRLNGKGTSHYCDRCNVMVKAVTPEQAAMLLEMSPTDVLRSISIDGFHLVGMTPRLPLLCGNSLGMTGM
jgi:hypothetical protein